MAYVSNHRLSSKRDSTKRTWDSGQANLLGTLEMRFGHELLFPIRDNQTSSDDGIGVCSESSCVGGDSCSD